MGRLRVALVGGPMYDGLYDQLGDVEVVVHADHPTLNRAVAERLAAGERIDVLSTHSKYAPSQRAWLRPLDGLVDAAAIGGLAPAAVDLCRNHGDLLCVPRNIDVRVLWWRADRMETAPDTWADVEREAAAGNVFGFTGRESGLFGLLYELVVGFGGQLFAADGAPTIDSPEAVAAVELLCRLAAAAPDSLPDWHYDQVDDALQSGAVQLAAAWPGGTAALRSSPMGEHLRPALYPAGPARRVSYSGCHAWAIPTTCGDVDGAVALVERLASHDAGAADAASGSVPAHVAAFAAVAPVDDVDAHRLAVTRQTIAEAMITYPPSPRFPEVEDAGWSAIREALLGRVSPAEAVRAVQSRAVDVLT